MSDVTVGLTNVSAQSAVSDTEINYNPVRRVYAKISFEYRLVLPIDDARNTKEVLRELALTLLPPDARYPKVHVFSDHIDKYNTDED